MMMYDMTEYGARTQGQTLQRTLHQKKNDIFKIKLSLTQNIQGTVDRSSIPIPLGEPSGHFIQSRAEFSHLIVLCIRYCVRASNTKSVY